MIGGGALLLALSAVLTAAPATGADRDVICTVNEEPIRVRDFEAFLFTDDCDSAAKTALDVIVKDRVVRQELARQGIAVKPAAVDEFLAAADREIRASGPKDGPQVSLATYLAAQGVDPEFFRRSAETTVGLHRLAGGGGAAYQDMSRNKAVQARAEEVLGRLSAAARVEADPDKLPPGVVAVINGDRVSLEEAGRVARLSLGLQARRKWLAELQTVTLILQELRRRRLELTNDDIDYLVKVNGSVALAHVGGRDVFPDEALKSGGQDVKSFYHRRKLRAAAAAVKMVRDKIDDDEIRRLYNADPARFGDGLPRVSLILLRTTTDDGRPFSEENERKVRVRIDALYKRLLGGEDFAALAGKFSEQKESAARGGDWGFLAADNRRDPAFGAAFGLKPGQISTPRQSADGWLLLKVTDVKKVPLDAARPRVLQAALRELCRVFTEGLRKNARIEPGPASP